MGAHKGQIRRIFITEGLLLGGIGACLGLLMAYLLCFLQMKFHLIKISGTSFIINYFPVSLLLSDFMLVSVTVMSIVLFASWLPTKKASTEALSLK
jgi:lipoprotein-releasing system permease protein